MRLTFLGVGSAFSRKSGNSNLLIESGSVKLLVDCSPSCPSALEEFGLSIGDITHVVITHLHADHIGGLEQLALQTKLVDETRKPTIFATASLLERLWNHSLCGGLEFIQQTPEDITPRILRDFFIPVPIDAEQWVTISPDAGLRIALHSTDHVRGMESYGMDIEELPGGRDKRVFFSGDTKFDHALIQHGVSTCALVFHDCQLADSGVNNIEGVHASYRQLRELPAELRRRLWLYHYGDARPLPDAEGDGFAGFVKRLQSFTF